MERHLHSSLDWFYLPYDNDCTLPLRLLHVARYNYVHIGTGKYFVTHTNLWNCIRPCVTLKRMDELILQMVAAVYLDPLSTSASICQQSLDDPIFHTDCLFDRN